MSSAATISGGATPEDAYESLERIVNPTFESTGDARWDKHNRTVESNIEKLRDRVQFGENLEKVIQLDGTECPWTQGVEPWGSEDNPDGDPNRLRTMWRNVDRKGFDECMSQTQAEGKPNYNKVYRNSDDNTPRYLMTKHPKMPYCVRCDRPKQVRQDYKAMVESIEAMADSLTASRRSKEFEKRARLIEDLERKKEEWNRLYDQIYWGKDVTQFRVPPTGCMDQTATSSIWKDPSKVKGNDQKDVMEVRDEKGNTKMVWNRPFAIKDPASGMLHCAPEDDPNVLADPHYHHLAKLSNLKRTDPGVWPVSDDGKPLSVAEVYNRAAFCAQLSQPGMAGETMCKSSDAKSAPLGQHLSASEACQWHQNVITGGSCTPADVQMDQTGEVSASDKFSEWYKEFSSAEKSMAANPATASSDFPKQRFMVPYTVPLPRGGGAELEAGGRRRRRRRSSSKA